jgi:lipid-binding SYLF domain-containing protein
LFAGLSVNGSNISVDKSVNSAFYGSKITSHAIFADAISTSDDVGALKTAIGAL